MAESFVYGGWPYVAFHVGDRICVRGAKCVVVAVDSVTLTVRDYTWRDRLQDWRFSVLRWLRLLMNRVFRKRSSEGGR